MTKREFENLALRGNKTISGMLYATIERFYMSQNNYHRAHGGINETKQDFVKRVFGGKVNSPRTILQKTIKESMKEEYYCIGSFHDKRHMDHIEELITEQYTFEAQHNY